MEALSKLLTALSGFAWPLSLAAITFYFRKTISGLLISLRRQIESGAALKWKDLEFKGLNILDLRAGALSVLETPADKEIFDKREKGFVDNKSVFLVHRVKKTEDLHKEVGLPLYELSIYLVGHKSYGHLNAVARVEYYLGKFFGIDKGEFGAKYVIDNGNDAFAVRTTAYGPTLCEARISFHDGTKTTINRYLDFEGTGYRFELGTDQLDQQRLEKRANVVPNG